jgi:predicted nucleic acid-binding protein
LLPRRFALICGVLWSEDIQDGIVIDRPLQIANPFRAG